MAKTLYILDGHSQIFRAYYAPFRDLTSPTGEPTRAVYVFCSMLLKFIADKKPDYLAMAVDGPAAKLQRREVYADYKVTRKPTPDDFHPQAERIMQIVEAMGIPVLQVEGHEADDILATAAERFAADDLQVVLVSRDKDLDQLINPNVVLYDPMKDEVIDADSLQAAKGYTPAEAVEIQTLTGDSTDNIPGVPGIGPKTAVKLIGQYGTADAVVAHADDLTPKQRENVLAAADTLPLTRQLVTLKRDVPLTLALDDVAFAGVGEKVRPIFAELGFNRLMDQLDELGVGGEAAMDVQAVAARGGQTTAADFDYTCIDTEKALVTFVKDLTKKLAKAKRLAVDTETTGTQPMWAELVGISLACEPGKAVYIPVKGPLGATTLDVDIVRKHLGGVLADAGVQKIGHNFKYDSIILTNAGFEIAGDIFDTMVAAHVLDSSRMTYKLDALAAELLGHHCIPIEEIIGRGRNQITMDTAPVDAVSTYAAEDADVTLRLADVLVEQLAAEQLGDLLAELEMPLLPVLADMERHGVLVDPQRLKKMETALSHRADELRKRIIALAGCEFNPDSPKQLAAILFDELELPVLKRTKTGPSTDASVLSQLAVEHELPALVLDYRKLTKLLGTYLKALAACIHPTTRRVHTSFNQAGTATGRLSSSDPNLQNIPIRSEDGRQIRSAFVAPEGCRLLSADYSQVELRMLAHLCEDETMMAAFVDDQDIHRIVAAEVFGVPLAEVDDSQRAAAKGVNFGIIYGQTAFGLSVGLRIPRGEAADFIKRYHARFPKIRDFLAACVEQAKAQGYVETIFGRRRRIVDIDAKNPQQRAAAERLAINSVVQGSAADLIKQAMVNIAARITAENRPTRMLLQIHDELVFETPIKAVDAEKTMVIEEMTGAIDLRIPLKVDVGVGDNWMDAK
ncbi:MAG: DNA polymerase I [Planctomycetota bacterium]|jgi:DNA polymerase-1